MNLPHFFLCGHGILIQFQWCEVCYFFLFHNFCTSALFLYVVDDTTATSLLTSSINLDHSWPSRIQLLSVTLAHPARCTLLHCCFSHDASFCWILKSSSSNYSDKNVICQKRVKNGISSLFKNYLGNRLLHEYPLHSNNVYLFNLATSLRIEAIGVQEVLEEVGWQTTA